MTQTNFGSYILGLAGYSLLREWHSPSGGARLDRLTRLATGFESNELLQLAMATPELEPAEGYTQWAPIYDGPNPMIAAEEPVVNPRLASLFEPGSVALDAGCGTGRHAGTMVGLGYDVIGTDLTPAMLAIAREKVPEADFREGVFEDLPVDDDAVDVIVSSLALCHAVDLGVAFGEFARVLRPGGTVIVSDPHPVTAALGGQAFFEGEGSEMPWVRNRAHPVSDYATAMLEHGFRIDAMQELNFDDSIIASNPASAIFPEITTEALRDLPFVLVVEGSLT